MTALINAIFNRNIRTSYSNVCQSPWSLVLIVVLIGGGGDYPKLHPHTSVICLEHIKIVEGHSWEYDLHVKGTRIVDDLHCL